MIHVYRAGGIATVVYAESIGSFSASCTKGKTKTCTATIVAMANHRWSVDLATRAVSVLVGVPTMTIVATDGPTGDTYAIDIAGPDNYTIGDPTPLPVVGTIVIG